MADHSFDIQRTIFWNVCEITAFRNQCEHLAGFLFDVYQFVVVRNLFDAFQRFACGKIWFPGIRAVCRLGMNKTKACVNPYSYEEYAFPELRNTILCKIIKMRFYNIPRSDAFKVTDYRVNGFSAIRRQ